jgi:hypothetical protein
VSAASEAERWLATPWTQREVQHSEDRLGKGRAGVREHADVGHEAVDIAAGTP